MDCCWITFSVSSVFSGAVVGVDGAVVAGAVVAAVVVDCCGVVGVGAVAAAGLSGGLSVTSLY